MAKKDKKAKKAKKAAKKAQAQFLGAAIENKGLDVAHKIWLAGVGAYGKAYDVATEGVGKVSGQGEVLFEDLVSRGEEIESDVRARLNSNSAIAKMSEQMSRVAEEASKVRGRVKEATEEATEAVSKFQEEQRERLEARMERMREALGLKQFSLKAKKADKLHTKLDDLEEQVAELRADADGVDEKVKARVERLSEEIAAVGGKPKKAKKAKPAKKTVKAAPKAKAKTTRTTKAAAAPKTDENGRLTKPIGTPDDLKMIKGVGAVLERRLNEAGVFHFWQIAQMRKAQMDALEAVLRFPGRMVRDNWKAQARAFAKKVVS
ncbi:MAG: phasin family protein [Henriciella sp.]|nr:phasin family protein [Henriciella sp.]MBO6695995.1 phasin family protein [Henriciella sp.]